MALGWTPSDQGPGGAAGTPEVPVPEPSWPDGGERPESRAGRHPPVCAQAGLAVRAYRVPAGPMRLAFCRSPQWAPACGPVGAAATAAIVAAAERAPGLAPRARVA